MKILELHNITKHYPDAELPAVNKVSFAIETGELLALVGESGSGKTTLLRLIAGLETPDEGQISIDSVEVAGKNKFVPPERRKVGLVFQDYALFPHMNVYKNVAYGVRDQTGENKRSQVAKYLSLVGLEGYEKRYPHELSGGQQQRVALARALAPEPALLLLDEPFSNLDTVIRDQVRHEVEQIIRKLGITAVFVTHNTADALAIADRIAIIKDGEVQQVDTPKSLYDFPVNEYVAGFMGRTNIITGKRQDNNIITDLGLTISAKGDEPDGQGLIYSLRPNHIGISSNGAGIDATVVKCTYLGEYEELVVKLDNGKLLTVYSRSEDPLKQGEPLKLKIDPAWLVRLQN